MNGLRISGSHCCKAGFTLVEVVRVLAVVGLLAAIVLTAIPRGTSRARLESYALETAALLKAHRNAAVRRSMAVETYVNASHRVARSRVTERAVHLPPDVAVEAPLASRCNQQRSDRIIQFFFTGVSCGSVITLKRQQVGYQVRVNWLTGGFDVAPISAL